MEKIYTKLSLVKTNRETHQVTREELNDITELVDEKHIDPTRPVRILAKGAIKIRILTKVKGEILAQIQLQTESLLWRGLVYNLVER